MKNIHKSALFALISVPITVLGIVFSFAIAHGTLSFMLLLLAPGLLVLWFVGDSSFPNWLLGVIGFVAQYISYFVIIHSTKLLLKKYKHSHTQIRDQ